VQELQQKYGNHPLPAVIVARGCLCLGTEIANSPCSKGKNFMLRGGSLASAGGPRQPAETGIDRAETLGPGGGQRTWKPGPDAVVGPTGAQESTPSLFPSASTYSGKSGGARAGGPRGMGEEGGRPVAGTRHATQPPAGAAAGRRASTVVACAVPLHGATVVGSNTGLGRGQDNGESSDVAQELGTTPGTASAVFPRLRYAMAVETNTSRSLASKIDALVSHTIDPIYRPNS